MLSFHEGTHKGCPYGRYGSLAHLRANGKRGLSGMALWWGSREGTHKGCPYGRYGRLAHLRAAGKRGFSGMELWWGGLRKS